MERNKNNKFKAIVVAAVLLLACLILLLGLTGRFSRTNDENRYMTRAEFIDELVGQLGVHAIEQNTDNWSFVDIDKHPSRYNIQLLVNMGILHPDDYGMELKPDEPITVDEIIRMLVRLNTQSDGADLGKELSDYLESKLVLDDNTGYVLIDDNTHPAIKASSIEHETDEEKPTTASRAVGEMLSQVDVDHSILVEASNKGLINVVRVMYDEREDAGTQAENKYKDYVKNTSTKKHKNKNTDDVETDITKPGGNEGGGNGTEGNGDGDSDGDGNNNGDDGNQNENGGDDGGDGDTGLGGGTDGGGSTGTGGGGGGGGSGKKERARILSFEFPKIAHTDTQIEVNPQLLHTQKVTWILERPLPSGAWETLDQEEYLSESLGETGGTVSFKQHGHYKLTATAFNGIGLPASLSREIDVYPVVIPEFSLPIHSHTDIVEPIATDLELLYGNNIVWTAYKEERPIDLSTVFVGDFGDEGGSLHFKEAGFYTIKATVTDEVSRVFSHEQTIQIYPVVEIEFSLPEAVHTDYQIQVNPIVENIEQSALQWEVVKDGQEVEMKKVYSTELTCDGGSFYVIEHGEYTQTGFVIDPTGRVFSTERSMTIHPVGEVKLSIEEYTHTDKQTQLTSEFEHLRGAQIIWSLTKDGKAVNISDYITGTPQQGISTLQFKVHGDYVITATFTDVLNRPYSHTAKIKIYPVPELAFKLPATSHTDTKVEISPNIWNIYSLPVEWLVKSGSSYVSYTNVASGTLNSNGGSITFKNAGTYEMRARIKDASGRVFEFDSTGQVKVYPIPTMTIKMATPVYAGDNLAVTVSGTNLSDLKESWLLSVDNGTATNYTSHANYTSGTLKINGGGTLKMKTDKTIKAKLTAKVTDGAGREFTFTSSESQIYPVPKITLTVSPATSHIGKNFTVSTSTSGLDGKTLTWTLKKGTATASYTGTLSNTGGSISIRETGTYTLQASVTNNLNKTFYSDTKTITITNNAPNTPTGSATVSRNGTDSGKKLKVTFSASATDPDGDTVTYEWSGRTSDDYYSLGTHTVKVRAKDQWGLYSGWRDITFTVKNSAPTQPIITRTPSSNPVAPGTSVKITASSTDSDGDTISYIWTNRPAENYVYPNGRNLVQVKAKDGPGMESTQAAVFFFVANNNGLGGMTLTGPNSTIIEEGIDGATISSYTFTVPPVAGHSGNDYGRVRGYNKNTNQWDTLDYQTTVNGITFTRTLSVGVYTKLEFYYYTDHDCMYNKSNITYTVDFHFA